MFLSFQSRIKKSKISKMMLKEGIMNQIKKRERPLPAERAS